MAQEDSEDEFNGIEMELNAEDKEKMKTKMITLALVMAKLGSYKETSISVKNRCEDIATAGRDKA